MAFRTHNPNFLDPVLSPDDKKWKPKPRSIAADSSNHHRPESPSDQGLININELIEHFEHITHGSTCKENAPNLLGNRLADLQDDSSQTVDETVGGEPLRLAGTTNNTLGVRSSSSLGLLSVPWASDRANKQGQFTFPPTSREWSSGDVTNDEAPSFRIYDPPAMVRTTGVSSSFKMEILRSKTRHGTSIDRPAPPKPFAPTPMNYSRAASLYIPEEKQGKPAYNSHVVTLNPRTVSCPTVVDTHKVEDYTRVIRGLTSKGTLKASEEAERVLRSMITKFEQGIHKAQPDGSCYNAVIHAFASLGMPARAEDILFLMFEDWKRGNMSAEPNVRIFTSVLKAWQRAKRKESPDRCENILAAMNELSSDPRLASCKPDNFAMTTLMHSWIDSKRKGVAAKVGGFFREMKKKYQSGDRSMQPDCITYSIVMHAYVEERSYKKAEAVLWEMVDDFLDGNNLAEPRVRNFNTILAMYARSSHLEAPLRVEAIVAKFRDLSLTGKLSIKPDAYTYSQLLKSWVKSGRKDGIDKAVTCFFWMKELGESGDTAAAPDLVKYSTIICAYAATGDHQQARSFLEVMAADYLRGNKNALPDIALYDHVVSACLGHADKKHPDAVKAADALISELWCLSESVPKLRPTMKMYSGVILKYVELKNMVRAHTLLMELLVTHHRVVGNPSDELCRTVINAWQVSKNPSKQSYMFRIRLAMFELQK